MNSLKKVQCFKCRWHGSQSSLIPKYNKCFTRQVCPACESDLYSFLEEGTEKGMGFSVNQHDINSFLSFFIGVNNA